MQNFGRFANSSRNTKVWAIHWAAALGNKNLLNLLVDKHGADINRQTDGGQTPLMLCVWCLNQPIKYLAACTANPKTYVVESLKRQRRFPGWKNLHELIPYFADTLKADLNVTDDNGFSVLDLALSISNSLVLKLLESGASAPPQLVFK